jgi:hypothetical protein
MGVSSYQRNTDDGDRANASKGYRTQKPRVSTLGTADPERRALKAEGAADRTC